MSFSRLMHMLVAFPIINDCSVLPWRQRICGLLPRSALGSHWLCESGLITSSCRCFSLKIEPFLKCLRFSPATGLVPTTVTYLWGSNSSSWAGVSDSIWAAGAFCECDSVWAGISWNFESTWSVFDCEAFYGGSCCWVSLPLSPTSLSLCCHHIYLWYLLLGNHVDLQMVAPCDRLVHASGSRQDRWQYGNIYPLWTKIEWWTSDRSWMLPFC